MTAELLPLRALLLSVSGWVNREQQRTIEYLVEENRVLKEQFRGRKLRLTDDQRRRLAAKGKQLGRRLLNRVATLVTPDTLMRWHRRLIALEWTWEGSTPGRLGSMAGIRKLIVRMAVENSTWGYTRIQGELKDLGHRVGRGTIARTLKDQGIKPAPERPSSWKSFLEAHWGEVAATDFFSTEVWTPKGLVTYYTLFLIDLKTRRVHIAGTTPHPDEAFMIQVARNPTDAVDGFLLPYRILICDRDTKFTAHFRRILKCCRVETVLTPPRAPNCNAHAERFVRSIKEECLGRMILFGEHRLHRAIREYVEHYHLERPHQGIGNQPPKGASNTDRTPALRVEAQERLGGLLRHYRSAA